MLLNLDCLMLEVSTLDSEMDLNFFVVEETPMILAGFSSGRSIIPTGVTLA